MADKKAVQVCSKCPHPSFCMTKGCYYEPDEELASLREEVEQYKQSRNKAQQRGGEHLAAITRLREQQRELVECLREARDSLRHAQVFIASREKMHPHGLELHDEAINKCDALLQRIEQENGRV